MTAVLDRPVEVRGSTTPRLFTRPLVTGKPGPCGCSCALTPETSEGFRAVRFAEDILGVKLLPYQRWLLIHALELRAPGRFRFRTLLILISRQNGKSWICRLVALYFLYVRGQREKVTVLGAAQSLAIAMESWAGAVELAEDVPDLAAEVDVVRRVNGEQCLGLVNGSRYKVSAATRGAGRGLSVDALLLDELREHRDWLAYGALTKTTTARANALTFGISNAGDDQSVVLNSLRSVALAETDDSVGLFEWSAPDGCELDDLDAWAQANPALGYTLTVDALRSFLSTDPPAVFRTENLCMRVDALDAALDLEAWKASADPTGSLAAVRDRVALCLDVAPDGAHVTLAGAGVLDDGQLRVEAFANWRTVDEARRALPGIVARVRPRAFGWFPSGPGAALGADLRGLDAVELKGSEVIELCQEFADLVQSRRIAHPNDPLLNAHVAASARLQSGDGWRFSRKGAGHVDGTYAMAGAVRIARTFPAPVKRQRARVFCREAP
ncbi:MAG: terminase [Pseudonocardia sp.]|nr:terminase [Pseudonocardia sp.]